MNLYVYGSGGNGCEIVDIAEKINRVERRWQNIYFVDDIREEKYWYGRDVYRFEQMCEDKQGTECVISLGEPVHREALYNKLKSANIQLATLIEPSAIVSDNANIGKGCIIGPNSFVSCNTQLDDNVMLEVQTIVGHDITVGKHSVLSSCTVIGGATRIGTKAFVGLNCTIKDKVSIGNEAIIGMGSSVFKDVDDAMIAMGNPARTLKKNIDKKVFS